MTHSPADFLSHHVQKQSMSTAEEKFFGDVLDAFMIHIKAIEEAPGYLPPVDFIRFPRGPISRPPPSENTHNAWAHKCIVTAQPPITNGILSSRRIVLKDNTTLAGVPCLMGTSNFTDWVPKTDATIVTRILEAGGTIVGKAVCENFSLSGVSATAATGPVSNPYAGGKPYNAGGSSSGCGALVGCGEVEMAMGGDQGGSIRLPAAWCGVVGLKPTRGLVPYTGIAPLDPSVDHTGPMTRTVLDNALLLQAVAGPDYIDDRQVNCPPAALLPRYRDELLSFSTSDKPLTGFRIGLLKESLEVLGIEPDMVRAIKRTAQRLEELGAEVVEVSVPEHIVLGPAVWSVMGHIGACREVFEGSTNGRVGLQLTDLQEKMKGWNEPERWQKLSTRGKGFYLTGKYLLETQPNILGKAINLSIAIRQAYTSVLESLGPLSVLLLPTTQSVARKLPTDNIEAGTKAYSVTGNTCVFDITGHPALSLPIGFLPSLDGDDDLKLPAACQLVGKWWDEMTVFKVAHSYETNYDWKNVDL